tara:strand:+ start:218 stop:685 length:468 start_codon:yes stop_codon:yes gene_type:complete
VESFVIAPLKNRFFSLIYELFLILGVLFPSTLLYLFFFDNELGLKLWLMFVLGFYFCGLWIKSGQTLAMKTWNLKIVHFTGTKILLKKAVLRFTLAWLWFLPGLTIAYFLKAKGWDMLFFPTINTIFIFLLTFFDKEKQFIHDRLSGTRIIHTKK